MTVYLAIYFIENHYEEPDEFIDAQIFKTFEEAKKWEQEERNNHRGLGYADIKEKEIKI